MNKEQTEKAIEVMQAWLDGKSIVITKIDDNYVLNHQPPFWDFIAFEYKIKQEPMEIYVNIYKGGPGGGCETKEKAEHISSMEAIRTAVLFREVTNE